MDEQDIHETVHHHRRCDLWLRQLACEESNGVVQLVAGMGGSDVDDVWQQRQHVGGDDGVLFVGGAQSVCLNLSLPEPQRMARSSRLGGDIEFVATRQGLAAALHSGDLAYSALPAYFEQHLGPALRALLQRAEDAGVVSADVDPVELLGAVANLCVAAPGADDNSRAFRMVALLLDGLRCRAQK